MSMKRFGEEKLYTLEKQGSFGRFVTGSSFPIEYILTSFSASELSDLTFARDIQPEKLDFDILMQRDIDEERVRKEIEPYLRPRATSAEIRSKAIFFPPLLVAIVPVDGKKMQPYYPDETGQIDRNQKDEPEFAVREWPGLFKISYFANKSAHAYPMNILEEGGLATQGVDLAPVNLEVRPFKGNEYGASLVVVDGQHRLCALKEVYEKEPELLKELVVPVCLLFSPNSTLHQQTAAGPLKVPTVPEVFRHLFVDVNTTMELVGGHFNILLSDNTIGSLICRKFCDQVLQDKGQAGIAAIEWNTKSAKDSTIIKREYSLTSIGVLELALRKSIGEQKSVVKYLLNLPDVDSKLYPENSDGIDFPKVEWAQFSLSQKKVLEDQVSEIVVPCLQEIFFGSHEFANAFNIFSIELEVLKKLADTDQDNGLEAKQVLNQVLEYIPIREGKAHDAARSLFRNFEHAIKEQRETTVSPMLGYAIFQRSIFDAWCSLLDYARNYGPEPMKVTKGFVVLLNVLLKDRGKFLSVERSYMQHAVFSGSKIKPTEETRKALRNLMFAHLGNPDITNNVLTSLDLSAESMEELSKKLIDEGQKSAGEFAKHFEKQRIKTFKGSFRIDFSLEKDEREDLAEAEDEQKLHQREVREGKRRTEDVSSKFDQLVADHVKGDVKLAAAELRNSLGYDSDIVGIESDDAEQ